MRSLLPAISALFALAVSSAAAAQADAEPASCAQAPAIVAVADYLLTEPAKVGRFWRDREASDAAFLRIRYSNLDYAKARGVLQPLGQRSKPPERWLELSLAQANAEDRARDIAKLQPGVAGAKSVVPQLGSSAWRASVLADGGEWMIAELARWNKAQPDWPAGRSLRRMIAVSLSDLPDDRKQAFAKRAEAAGLLDLAFWTYAQEANLADAVALLDRVPAGFFAKDEGTRSENRIVWLRSAIGDAMYAGRFDPAVQPAEIKSLVKANTAFTAYETLGRLVAIAPEMLVLSTLVNQTGDMRIVTEVAAGLLVDIDAKKLDPHKTPDMVLADTAQRLQALFGRERLDNLLKSFEVSAALAEDSHTALALFNEAVARNALAPLVKGGFTEVQADAAVRTRPDGLSKDFDWLRWAMIARGIQQQQSLNDWDKPIAGSLLTGAMMPGEALEILKSATDWQAARPLAQALMRRLDRGCSDQLKPQTTSMEPIYRFD